MTRPLPLAALALTLDAPALACPTAADLATGLAHHDLQCQQTALCVLVTGVHRAHRAVKQ